MAVNKPSKGRKKEEGASKTFTMIVPKSSSSQSQQSTQDSLVSKLIELPHIAYTFNGNTEIFIIGTSHLSSNSASEVQSLISNVKPDGVVLELDPERCIRLTKQACGFDASGDIQKTGDVVYGADFLAAINACIENDIPLFLGDEYAQETRERLLNRITHLDAYSPLPLFNSLMPRLELANISSRIDVIETFRRDPNKLTPLVVTTSPPFVLASVLALMNNQHSVTTYNYQLGSTIEIGLVIIASVLLSSLLFNNIIVERDQVLAKSAIRAATILKSLKEGRSIRKRWEFKARIQQPPDTSSKQQILSRAERDVVKDVPLFTLKTPIEKGKIRNLNLFEPRWLKMIDQLRNNPSQDLKLGCVRCTNKFYSVISINEQECRYADIIFDTIGNLADVMKINEGQRPISGDRRLSVSMRGGDSFIIDESNLSICDEGYMIASAVETHCLEHVSSALDTINDNNDEVVRIVIVVGLLHGNGILSLLSEVDC